jgi:signal peptidase I
VTGAFALRPLLDAAAPADPAAAGRRVRFAAIWMALSAWLLPPFAGLGTETTAHRAVLCAAFAAAAVAAHFRLSHRWARVALPVAAVAAAALVAWFGRGALWGFGFLVFAVVVVAATELRNRFVRLPPPPPEPDPLPPGPARLPRFLNWYAWFGITVLFMWRFVGQGMVVPTGSMQPTIMGSQGRNAPGDHVFVDEFSYLFREPRRWEIVVFKYPLFRERNFVKRLIGLPGEHVEIRDGDIWVNGKIARKPPLVQATMWRELFPRPGPFARPKTIVEGFTQDTATGGDWKRVSDAEVRCTPGKGQPSLAFCNSSATYPDVRLVFTAVPDGHAIVLARITSHGVPVTLRLDAAGASGASTFSVGRSETKVGGFETSGGAPLCVEMCVVDGEAWALVDGREVARAEVPFDGRGTNRVEIGAATDTVSFRDVVVDRDVVYDVGGGPAAYDVPADGFFFLGDNVAESEDSRKWTVSVFRTPSGETVRAAPQLITETGDHADNIVSDRTSWKFADVDGIARELPVAGTTRTDVRAPFATRGDLIGRAILVFWPLVPAEAGFRPRLLP